MLSLFRTLVVFVAVIIGLAFGYLNFQNTSVDLLWLQTQAPLVLLLAIAFILGGLIAVLLLVARMLRLRTSLSSTRRKLRDAEAEISSLRSTPARDA